jgi:hypothetical protein
MDKFCALSWDVKLFVLFVDNNNNNAHYAEYGCEMRIKSGMKRSFVYAIKNYKNEISAVAA